MCNISKYKSQTSTCILYSGPDKILSQISYVRLSVDRSLGIQLKGIAIERKQTNWRKYGLETIS